MPPFVFCVILSEIKGLATFLVIKFHPLLLQSRNLLNLASAGEKALKRFFSFLHAFTSNLDEYRQRRGNKAGVLVHAKYFFLFFSLSVYSSFFWPFSPKWKRIQDNTELLCCLFEWPASNMFSYLCMFTSHLEIFLAGK